MIIGSILDVATGSSPGSSASNGVSSVIFYTEREAVEWAILQSLGMLVNSNTYYCFTSVINTTTGSKRWWYNGIEYTG